MIIKNTLTGLSMMLVSWFMCILANVSFSMMNSDLSLLLMFVCDIVIYAGLMWNAGYKMAERDYYQKQSSLKKSVLYGVLTSLVVWIPFFVLLLARFVCEFSFIDVYKILNNQLLPIVDFLAQDSEQSSLSAMDCLILFFFDWIPIVSIFVGYFQTTKGLVIEKGEK